MLKYSRDLSLVLYFRLNYWFHSYFTGLVENATFRHIDFVESGTVWFRSRVETMFSFSHLITFLPVTTVLIHHCFMSVGRGMICQSLLGTQTSFLQSPPDWTLWLCFAFPLLRFINFIICLRPVGLWVNLVATHKKQWLYEGTWCLGVYCVCTGPCCFPF